MADNDWETVDDWEDVPVKGERTGKYSGGQSSLLGIADSFGFVDELGGAMKSPMGALKKAGSYLGYDTEGDPDVAAYTKERDIMRKNLGYAEEDNPTAYGASKVAGYVGQAATGAPVMAAISQGIGGSESETLPGMATDVAVSGALAKLGGSVGSTSKVLSKLPPDKTANVVSKTAHALPWGGNWVEGKINPMIRNFLTKKAAGTPQDLFKSSAGLMGSAPKASGMVGKTIGASGPAAGMAASDVFRKYFQSKKFRDESQY